MSGGKFNMAASILGAYVIQFLTTTLYSFNVDSSALPAYKAVVVIILVGAQRAHVPGKADQTEAEAQVGGGSKGGELRWPDPIQLSKGSGSSPSAPASPTQTCC